MTYYTRTYNPQPTARVTSQELKNEFQAIDNALDAVEVDVGKGLRAPEATTALPNAASRALKVLSFDASGNPRATIAEVDLTTAVASAAAAALSESNAATSASSASTSATNAGSSATSASGSASTATTQAVIATTQAGIATTQAGIATTQAGNASTSAGTATTQAGIATTKAGEANTSAIAAAASAATAASVVASIPDGTINDATTGPLVAWSSNKVSSELGGKQATLVSGTNIKTLNGASLLGSGNLTAGDVTLTGTQTLTNKTISGANNTITADGTNPVGFLSVPQNDQATTYTLVLSDAGKHIHKSGTSAYTVTIPANASVTFPIGTAVTFVNSGSSGAMTIAISSDTLRIAGAGTTGSKTLDAYGAATAIKVTSTLWMISGSGLT